MAELSSSVIHKFVDLTSEEDESKGYYSYATGIVNGNDKYVQLDGSDTVASVSLATDLSTGDRVLVYIENHTATVVGNITYPTSGRAVIEINENLLDFEELTVGNFAAIDGQFETIETDYLEAIYASVDYLLAEIVTANYILAETIEANYATIYDLTVLQEYVETLEASEITVEYLDANYADINSLTVLQETVAYLEAQMITVDELEANYARIKDLEVTNENVANLTADYSNLKYVLAGYESVEDLQSIHLTADNVVIDNAIITDAMIADLSASKLTAGTIYTSLVRIQTAENDTSLYFNDSLIQMSENDLVRFQAGKDATGEYGLYIWNSEGKIMFDATGATSDGIGKEVIVNDMVADTANIAGYKLDIDSVVSCINDNGNLEVDSSHVTINGNTLDYEIDSIIQEIDSLELGEGVTKVVPYFAVSDSPGRAPVSEEEFYPAYADEARVDYSYADVYEYEDLWTTDQPVGSDQYVWVKFKFVYNDGSESWSDPILLSDGYLRTVTTAIQTELEVIQGQISLKVWESDIESAVNIAINDLWSEITVELGNINLTVGDLYSDINSMSATISDINIALGEISLTVSDVYTAAVTTVDIYFALSDSPDRAPVDEIDFYPAYADVAKADYSYVDVYEYTDLWTTDKPTPGEDQYVWAKLLYTYLDGTTGWSEPFLYTDERLLDEMNLNRESISSIEVALNSISLTTYSEGNGMARIILKNGSEESDVEVVEEAAKAFEYDLNNNKSSIYIEAGSITFNSGTSISFNSGTLTINSNNFTLDSEGNAVLNSATSNNLIADSAMITNSEAVNLTVTGDSYFYGDVSAKTLTLVGSKAFFNFEEKADEFYEEDPYTYAATLLRIGYWDVGQSSLISTYHNYGFGLLSGIPINDEEVDTSQNYMTADFLQDRISLSTYSSYYKVDAYLSISRGIIDMYGSSIFFDGPTYFYKSYGSSTRPVYVDSSGSITQCATTVILTSGDTENIVYYGGGYITSSSAGVNYTPSGKTLTGISSVSISSWSGVTIRQSGYYCYGSSSSSYTKPSSYTVSANAAGQFHFALSFGNTTNVSSNNASCGVAMPTATLSFS